MGRTVVCRGKLEDGTLCTNATSDVSRFCPEHRDRPGFAGRFRRTPDHPIRGTYAWQQLAKRTVQAWVKAHGWLCPGWRREAHRVKPGRLAADHPDPLALGGAPLPRQPGVLCSSCNARKGLSQRQRRPRTRQSARAPR